MGHSPPASPRRAMKGPIFLLSLVVGQIIAQDCFNENVKITGKLLTKKKTFFLVMENCLALCKETKRCLGVNYIADHKKKKKKKKKSLGWIPLLKKKKKKKK